MSQSGIPASDAAKRLSAEADAAPISCVIVTGLSGAGKSTALRVFEDMGHFAVDGLPAGLAPEMAAMMESPSMAHYRGIVLGMDLRQGEFLPQLNEALAILSERGIHARVLFLEARASELMRRYATTRRPHPLERSGRGLEAALEMERESLLPLREMADLVIDSTQLSIHDLRRVIQKRWSRGRESGLRPLRVNVLSFGFKYGVPADADFVFDMRFLPNPYFVPEMRERSGQEKDVADYVFAGDANGEFRRRLEDFLLFTLPLVEAEGRWRVTIALGCTGGRHRSVAMAEHVRRTLRQAGYLVGLEHRHLDLG